MPHTSDIIVIGGGIAGLSAAAELSRDASVMVLEAEEQIGFHSSGRSATMVHYALGDRLVRALTLASRAFFESPPDGFSEIPLGRRMPVLVHAREDEREALDALECDIIAFADLERLDARGVHELCPLLRDDAVHGIADRDGIRLDPHALLQGYLRMLRHAGDELVTAARVASVERRCGVWTVTVEGGASYSAPILVNAAGAWADKVASMAGAAPIGLQPLRRTIITFDAPPGTNLEDLPFAKTVGDQLYFASESGRLFASPMDEVPTEACDAQAEELEVALAAYRVEERTTIKVDRIHSRWAGLRTFTPDRNPAVGFAPDSDGFFWLAGQGGFGLQTSPAMARIAASLILHTVWPMKDLVARDLSPGRFLGQAA
ncbi:FAD-dependent catabolic D-arginine dehydrogenase DauA [Sphingomonas limnosediminicola]|uniref:FAD-dependent catabolic D-arginine dehydrogenase DauA n=1 Tax=Sphingomonas limnosediminicola TaxID=940133 RepID=A0ABP7KX25_9SPHN